MDLLRIVILSFVTLLLLALTFGCQTAERKYTGSVDVVEAMVDGCRLMCNQNAAKFIIKKGECICGSEPIRKKKPGRLK